MKKINSLIVLWVFVMLPFFISCEKMKLNHLRRTLITKKLSWTMVTSDLLLIQEKLPKKDINKFFEVESKVNELPDECND